MSKGKVALGVVAGLFVIYMVAAPYITVYQMKSAAETRDGEALSEHIDFPSVRQSMKDQMNVMWAKKMAEDDDMKNNPLAALGTVFAGTLVEKMVDGFVTPAGITELMAGQKPTMDAGKGSVAVDNPEREPFSNASMSYESLDKFVVTAKGNDGREGRFILRRQGISWKLTAIIVPFDGA